MNTFLNDWLTVTLHQIKYKSHWHWIIMNINVDPGDLSPW